MDDSTKKKLEKAGKIFLGIAEVGAGSMQSTAKSYSRNKKLPEEYREKYSEMAEGFGELKSTLHDYKERIGRSGGNYEEEYDDFEDNDYVNECKDECVDEDHEVISNKPQSKRYSSEERTIKQENSVTTISDNYTQMKNGLESKWKSLGYLKDIDCNKLSEDGAGIIRLVVDDEVVYLVRAIELNDGGITKKILDLQEYSAKRKPRVYAEISKKIEKIKVEIISMGNDEYAVANSRKLEKELLQKYRPIWL